MKSNINKEIEKSKTKANNLLDELLSWEEPKKTKANAEVDSGQIVICDSEKNTNDKNGDYSIIELNPGRYITHWEIKNSWNGTIFGTGIVDCPSGKIIVTDPCYIFSEKEYKTLWALAHPLKETSAITDHVTLAKKGITLINTMGGDGSYKIEITLNRITTLQEIKDKSEEIETIINDI